MKSIKEAIGAITLFVLILLVGNLKMQAQTSLAATPEKKIVLPPSTEEISKLLSAVESSPADLASHQAYIKAVGTTDPTLEKQYGKWMKKFPKSAVIPYAIGDAFARAESPKAKPWLLKAVEIDPKHAEAYKDLWLDAERWGDFEAGRKYLGMGAAADLKNPDLAFYYANSFDDIDFDKYRTLSQQVVKNFPDHERGAQALYWLASKSNDPNEKVRVWEQLRSQYPPAKFSWSNSGMSTYFDYLLNADPSKALDLAQSMVNLNITESQAKTWGKQIMLAQSLVFAKKYISEKKPFVASAILKEVKLPSYSKAADGLIILQSQAADLAGNSQESYDSLAAYYAKTPSDRVGEALKLTAAKLGKTPAAINDDILKIHNAAAKPATPFTLEQYLKPGSASLSDFKGKVVLITYWFPGCGPCRGEFPHFENVVKKFEGQDFVYLALNIVPDQDEYVIPFVKTSGYSFIPLRDVKGREKGNLDNGRAAPVNFLVDKDGKVVFSKFRTDASNERTLELMISSLLKGKAI